MSLKSCIKPLVILVAGLLPLSAIHAGTPSFTGNTLTLPSVKVGELTFNNVQLELDLTAGTASLKSFEEEHVYEMRTLLSPSLELPATNSNGAAGSLMSVDIQSGAISGFIMTKGITDLTAAHIHEGAADESGASIITLELDSETNVFTIPAGTVLTADQITAITEGRLYLNVHTTTNGGGELRSQLNINSAKNADAKLTALIGS